MIFDVKQDGRHKARLVAGGHMVDPMDVDSRSTVVKGISVRLLDLIAQRDNLPILCGDVGNAFITATCMEKIYTCAGPEFGNCKGSLLIFKKELYSLRSPSRAFRTHFADFLRPLGITANPEVSGCVDPHARNRTATIISAPTWRIMHISAAPRTAI